MSYTLSKNSAIKVADTVRKVQGQGSTIGREGTRRKALAGSNGSQIYKIETITSSTCKVYSIGADGTLTLQEGDPSTCIFPCVSALQLSEITAGSTFLAWKVGSVYVADPPRWV